MEDLPQHMSTETDQYTDKGSSKEKRPPSITPRKFTRFFTPRSHGSSAARSSRRALFDVTTPANNRNGIQSSPIRPFSSINGQENSPTSFTREMKRRKLLHTPIFSSDSSNSEKSSLSTDAHTLHHEQDQEMSKALHSENAEESICKLSTYPDYCNDAQNNTITEELGTRGPIRSIVSRGLAGTLLRMRLDSNIPRRRYESYPASDWQDQTASFYSRPEDTHFCTSIDSSARCIPFCVASCNTNSLVAVGDEEGRIRILESAKQGKPAFKDPYITFRPHSNAIIDMCFSQDDSLLATASGDQTSRVIDMATQTTISVLAQHTASLKQVRFQPGAANNSVIATSSRDGSVHIWDLRCKGVGGPIQTIHMPLDGNDNPPNRVAPARFSYGYAVNSIYQAHQPAPLSRTAAQSIPSKDGVSRGEAPGRAGDVSVTAIHFLPAGQEHLLLTASEVNATVKLWDIRSLQSTRRNAATATALSGTAQPQSHSQWRHFGVSSLNISGDGSRLYALCKDNTVYAYSMAHLIVGRAPELSTSNPPRRRQMAEMQEGLGPIYGFRHPKLHVTSFYVKSAIRPARNGKAEMLAVGSSGGSTILFPTDERYRKHLENISSATVPSDQLSEKDQVQPPIRRTQSEVSNGARVDNDVPIFQNGTPLVRGHDREVGALTWTSEGELVTVGDDFLVRCWREGDDARDLRTGGEEGGRRWGSGWAEVSEMYDEDYE